MSCLPGSPCNPIGPVYPEGMGPCNPCYATPITACAISYDGPNLPCTGVNNGDNLQLALEKIDDAVCTENILNKIIQLLKVNPAIRYQFCLIVNECVPPTTTTTTTLV